jgi:hypothetical protein
MAYDNDFKYRIEAEEGDNIVTRLYDSFEEAIKGLNLMQELFPASRITWTKSTRFYGE